jgi:hypothetical protein
MILGGRGRTLSRKLEQIKKKRQQTRTVRSIDPNSIPYRVMLRKNPAPSHVRRLSGSKLITNLHLVARLRVRGAPYTPPYAFMAWCYIQRQLYLLYITLDISNKISLWWLTYQPKHVAMLATQFALLIQFWQDDAPRSCS